MSQLCKLTIVGSLIAAVVGCGGREFVSKGVSPGSDIHLSIVACDLERVKALVEDNPGILETTKPFTFGFPLETAIAYRQYCGDDILNYLLAKDPKPNAIVVNRALFEAVRTGDQKLISLLLRHGADVNAERRDMSGKRQPLSDDLLTDALRSQNLDVVRFLLEQGVQISVCAMAATGDVHALRTVLAGDPKLAQPVETPVPTDQDRQRAWSERERERAKKIGAPWNWSAMDCAVNFRQRESAKAVLEFVQDPTLSDLVGSGDASLVRDYLNHHPGAARASNEAPLWVRLSPLWKSVEAGYTDVAALLIERGADPNNRWQMQRLIGSGDAAMVKFLIDHGADVRDKPGWPSLSRYAFASKHPEIAEIIRQAQ